VHGSKGGSIQAGLIGDLRVLVSYRDGFWFARGLEIDYAAQGSSMAEVKRNFEQGLALTIDEHVKRFGNLDRLLLPSPPEAWRRLHEFARHLSDEQVSVQRLPQKLQNLLKFQAIRFFESGSRSAVA
jgi:hypothetical protein